MMIRMVVVLRVMTSMVKAMQVVIIIVDNNESRDNYDDDAWRWLWW